ncbi:MAG TPA: NADH-quinone oxidoreductase subunit NuoK [Candidatus Polarisedimenticolia bacterium]|nr:NADH-quinone oxidoreductase subunit NuoK [Candidatus Polarisedimenticolia bacterium]
MIPGGPPPASHALVLAALLFVLGLSALLARRNLLFMLLAIEIMLNAAGLAFVAAGAAHGQADGQVMFFFILTMAGVEVAVGLALVLRLSRALPELDADQAARLKD